jgi:hypothetical protein
MSLPIWLKSGWLQAHQTSPEEIRDLWRIVERDLNCVLIVPSDGAQPGGW